MNPNVTVDTASAGISVGNLLTSPQDDMLMKRKRGLARPAPSVPTEDGELEHVEAVDLPVAREIRETLVETLCPSHLELVDDSASHRGHAGAAGYGAESHFQVCSIAVLNRHAK